MLLLCIVWYTDTKAGFLCGLLSTANLMNQMMMFILDKKDKKDKKRGKKEAEEGKSKTIEKKMAAMNLEGSENGNAEVEDTDEVLYKDYGYEDLDEKSTEENAGTTKFITSTILLKFRIAFFL